MKKEEIQKIILGALIASGVIYSYVSYLFLPELSQIQSLGGQLQVKQAQYHQLVNLQAQKNDLQQQISIAEEELQKGSLQVPGRLDKPELAMKLYNLANNHGVSAQSLRFDPPKNKGIYQEMTLSFDGVGPASSIVAFISGVEHEQPILAIQSVNLTNQNGLLHCDIMLTAFATQ